jgi:hypothetical protein
VFRTKPISHDSVAGALAKAERYRLLNQPGDAESICRDILDIEPGNQRALSSLVLALTDQLPEQPRCFDEALLALSRLESSYDRAYFAGLAWERRAKARTRAGGHGSGTYAYEWLHKAMDLFEQAEALRTEGNDDSILRWNACVRFLKHHPEVRPREQDVPEPILSE